MTDKPTLSLDFDGVIHAYRDGWRQGQIYDSITPGFFKWANEAAKHFKLVIHSSRAGRDFGADRIKTWLDLQMRDHWHGQRIKFEITAMKPPAFITIDDRAITFNGDWSDPRFAPSALLAFKPWTANPQP